MSPPRLKAWLVAAVIFIGGAVVGGGGTAWLGLRLLRHAIRASSVGGGLADRAALRIGSELTSSLKLTPEQSIRIQAILDHSAGNLKTMRARVAADAVAELRDSTARIAAELPAEKRPEFYRLIARRYERLGLPAPTPENH